MAGLNVFLLGGIEADLASGARVEFPTRKARGLLAYLAWRPGQRHSRERLAALLWGTTGDEQARANLRQSLSMLRRSLGPSGRALIARDGDTLYADPEGVQVDIIEFEELCGRSAPRALESAAALYRGDFLEGFELREEAFEDWLSGERARLDALCLDALSRLLAHYTAHHDLEGGINTALRLIARDPLQEHVHRSLMQLYLAQGRRKSALNQYQLCSDVLRKELGVAPDTETQRLYQRLRRERSTILWSTPPELPNAGPLTETIAAPQRPSLAIMPFRNAGGDRKNDYIADGIGLSIQTLLVQLSGLFLVNAAGDQEYRQGKVTAAEAVRDIPVRYVIEGTAQRDEQMVRVSVQITDLHDNAVVWAERYDRKLEDVFLLQDEITREVISSLRTEVLEGEDTRIWVAKLSSPTSWSNYLRGVSHFYKLTPDDNVLARQMFERLYQEQPDVVHGPSFIAATHLFDALRGWTDDGALSRTLAAQWAEKAIAYEDNNGLGHAVLGHLRLVDRRHDEALQLCEKAVEYRRCCPLSMSELALAQLYMGEASKAVASAREALALRIVYPPSIINVLAMAYRDNNQIGAAITTAREAARFDPGHTDPLVTLCTTHVQAGDHDQARRIAKEITTVDPGFDVLTCIARHPYKDPHDSEKLAQALRTAGLRD